MTEYCRVVIKGALSSLVDPRIRLPSGSDEEPGEEVLRMTLWVKGRPKGSLFDRPFPDGVDEMSLEYPDAQTIIDELVGPIAVSSRPGRSAQLQDWETECRAVLLDRVGDLDLGDITWLSLDPGSDPSLRQIEVHAGDSSGSDFYIDTVNEDGDYVIGDFLLARSNGRSESVHRVVGYLDPLAAVWQTSIKPRRPRS